jgi:nucleoside-diphosphate-sugar epimerase
VRVLVTGASGFIGGHTARHLAAGGRDVVAVGRDPARLAAVAAPRIEPRMADLARDDLDAVVAGCDAVIHCAAFASPWGPRAEFERHNVTATQRLLDACARAGSVTRFVHLSSPSIYYQARDRLDIPEAFTPPARWRTTYGESKWRSECRVLAPGFRALGPVILRPRAVFGPRDAAIVPRLLAIARRGFFPLVRNGEALVDVTCIDNLLHAIERALAADGRAVGRAFNITNGESVTVATLVRDLFAALRRPVRLVPLPRALAMTLATVSEGVAHLVPGKPEPRLTRYGIGLLGYSQTLSIAAAREVLRYAPTVSTREGLERYARWTRGDG